MKVLVTGAAGFIGAAVATRLLTDGHAVAGLDNLNSYYDVALKEMRLARLHKHAQTLHADFCFEKIDLVDRDAVVALMKREQPDVVVHLAAQAGVRYSLENPVAYLESNLIGHFNVLEACRLAQAAGYGPKHVLYASSSSVYGANESYPFKESDDVSRPVSLYAATKRADEMVSFAWAHQFGLPLTGLRFFTVYGPWGRPDMSPMLFANALTEGRKIPLFNGGDLWRDFTFIDDIVEAIVRLIPVVPTREAFAGTPHSVYNLGNQSPVQMVDFVKVLAGVLGLNEPVEALVDAKEWPATEVYKTAADTQKLQQAIGWAPATPLEKGLAEFGAWFMAWKNGTA